MNRGVKVSLQIARYGLIGSVAVLYLSAQPPLAPDRLWAGLALLALIAAAGYTQDHLARTRAHSVLAYAAEVALIIALGLVLRGGPFFLLYFMAVGELFVVFPPRQGLWLAAGLYAAMAVNLLALGAWRQPVSFAANMLSLLPAFLFIGAVSYLAREQAQARQRAEQLLAELQSAHDQLQRYASQVEDLAVSRERNRMAQEIHDSIAHSLTGLLVQLQAARRLLASDPARAEETLRRAEESTRRGLDDVRRSVRALRPEMPGGAPDSLRRVGREFQEATGVSVEVALEGEPRPLPADIEVILYRSLQECLTNAVRHGQASRVAVHLAFDNGGVRLITRDDGRGAEAITPGLGLQGLRDRATSAGGTFTYRTAPGAGFEAIVTLPLSREPVR